MEIQTRRVTRSSAGHENDIAKGKQQGLAGKDGLRTRRAFGDQKNSNELVKNKAAGPLKSVVAAKPIASVKQVAKPKRKPLAPVERAEELYPEVVGIEREFGCVEFSDDVMDYLLSSEKTYTMEEGFLDGTAITPKMRCILVDWLIQVHQRFHLLPETLHLTVYLVDCMLADASVVKTELQLVGVTCMLVASKYEEMYSPEITDFEYITDNAFTKQQILRMEMKVLHSCGFILARPHSIAFLRSFNKKITTSARVHNLSKYLGELALLDYSLAHLLPSTVAVVSFVVAHRLTDTPLDVAHVGSLVGMSSEEVEELVPSLARVALKLNSQHKLIALKTKYGAAKLCAVSIMSEDVVDKLEQLSALNLH